MSSATTVIETTMISVLMEQTVPAIPLSAAMGIFGIRMAARSNVMTETPLQPMHARAASASVAHRTDSHVSALHLKRHVRMAAAHATHPHSANPRAAAMDSYAPAWKSATTETR